jgi:hypothetical protein
MLFSSRPTPIFLPKHQKTGLFLLSVRFLECNKADFSLDGVQLTEFSEIRSFPAKLIGLDSSSTK